MSLNTNFTKKFFLFFALVVLAVFSFGSYRYYKVMIKAPKINGIFSTEEVKNKGLFFENMSVKKGLSGWYEKDNKIVYFEIKRLSENSWDERFLFCAPRYAIGIVFADNKGEIFYNQASENKLKNKNIIKEEYRNNNQPSKTNFELAKETINLIKQTQINAEMNYEYEALEDVKIK